MDKRTAVKLSTAAGFLAIIAIAVIGGRDSSRRNTGVADSAATDEKSSEGESAPGGSLLSGGQTSGRPVTSEPAKPSGTRDEGLLKRLARIDLNPKLENVLRAGDDPVARDLLSYLRTRKAKNGFSPAELNALSGPLMDSLKENPEAALSLVARGLAGIEGSSENRQDRLDLLGLVGAFPAAESPEISRNALATLTDLYANGGGMSAEDGFESTVTAIQAYLVTTRADADAANSAVTQAMGGKIDPAVKEVYRNLFNDRYPARR